MISFNLPKIHFSETKNFINSVEENNLKLHINIIIFILVETEKSTNYQQLKLIACFLILKNLKKKKNDLHQSFVFH